MRKSLHQKVIHSIRSNTPLSVRQRIGPVIAFILYIINVYVRKSRAKPHVLTIDETLDKIITENLSLIRFGDGEITLIDGSDISYHKYNKELADRLETIIKKDEANLLICVPGIWDKLDMFESYAYWFNMHHVYRQGHAWNSMLNFKQVYGDTNITRFYLAYKEKHLAATRFKKLFSIWKNRDVVLIEGTGSRLGLGNDMFDGTKSLRRILCPPDNAFNVYRKIKEETLKISKDCLILISLGPTAKVLAYDLFKSGYRVLDVGHIDMEYEMFLRKLTKQTKVKYKYFNEINERNPEDTDDPKYLSQIIASIM